MNKVLIMDQLACVGKTSLSASLPILSTMEFEAIPLPTSISSTSHYFEGNTYHDLTDHIQPMLRHLDQQGISIDGIFVNHLPTVDTVSIASTLFNLYPNTKLKYINLQFAHKDAFLDGYDQDYVEALKPLLSKADYVSLHISEACKLVDIPYRNDFNEEEIQDILRKLSRLDIPVIILKSISFDQSEIGTYVYQKENDSFNYTYTDCSSNQYPGIGDIWASVFFGGLMNDMQIEEAIQQATEFIIACIEVTDCDAYGLSFEETLYLL